MWGSMGNCTGYCDEKLLAIRLNFDFIPEEIVKYITLELSNLNLAMNDDKNIFTKLQNSSRSIKRGLYATKKHLEIENKIGDALAKRLIRNEDGSYDEELVKQEYYHGNKNLINMITPNIFYKTDIFEFRILYIDLVNNENEIMKLINIVFYILNSV